MSPPDWLSRPGWPFRPASRPAPKRPSGVASPGTPGAIIDGTGGEPMIAARQASALLRCDWGRVVCTPDDQGPCPNRAQARVVLHERHASIGVQVCSGHRDRLFAETDPHEQSPLGTELGL